MTDIAAIDISYIVVAQLIVLLNAAEMVLILRKKDKKIFDKLLLSLAASDLLVGMSIFAFKIAELNAPKKSTWQTPTNFTNMYVLSMIFSITNLVGITIERFLAVKFPIKHRMMVTKKKANVFVAIMWVLSAGSVVFCSLVIFLWKNDMPMLLQGSSISLLFHGVWITAAYAYIFHLIRKRYVATTTTRGDGNVSRRGFGLMFKGPNRAERSVFLTSCLVAVSFIVCTYPFAIEYLITGIGSSVSTFLIVLNSLLNPFIYFFKSYSGEKRSPQV